MTNRTAMIWIIGALATMLVLGRRKDDAPAISGTPRRREPTADKLRRKIQEFIDEVRLQQLTDEQRKIYSVFAGEQNTAEIKVHDMLELYDIFKVKKGTYKYGAQHILIKHYNARKSSVTANDILNMCYIIKNGIPKRDDKNDNRYYEIERDGVLYKLVIKLNESGDSATLVTFYTEKRETN